MKPKHQHASSVTSSTEVLQHKQLWDGVLDEDCGEKMTVLPHTGLTGDCNTCGEISKSYPLSKNEELLFK